MFFITGRMDIMSGKSEILKNGNVIHVFRNLLCCLGGNDGPFRMVIKKIEKNLLNMKRRIQKEIAYFP